MTDDRCQTTDVRSQMTDDRCQMTDDPSSLFELRRGTQMSDDKKSYLLFVIGYLSLVAGLRIKARKLESYKA